MPHIRHAIIIVSSNIILFYLSKWLYTQITATDKADAISIQTDALMECLATNGAKMNKTGANTTLARNKLSTNLVLII